MRASRLLLLPLLALLVLLVGSLLAGAQGEESYAGQDGRLGLGDGPGIGQALLEGDFDGDDNRELVLGTQTGLIVLFSHNETAIVELDRVGPFDGRVEALALGDLTDSGSQQLVAVTSKGEIAAFNLQSGRLELLWTITFDWPGMETVPLHTVAIGGSDLWVGSTGVARRLG